MTGPIHYTPEAEQQLDDLDEWITQRASADVARHFTSSVMAHCEQIALFPQAGRRRDDVRPGLLTTTFRKRTVIAYAVSESTEGATVTIIGGFHGAGTGKRT